MKALTLWQPWASLVAVGWKGIETRSWGTDYRGPLAIHAALTMPTEGRALATRNLDVMRALHPLTAATLPLGKVVAVVHLWRVARIVSVLDSRKVTRLRTNCGDIDIDARELVVGDYTPGRYVWFVNGARQPEPPVPARGNRMLWDWDATEEVMKGAADAANRVQASLFGGE